MVVLFVLLLTCVLSAQAGIVIHDGRPGIVATEGTEGIDLRYALDSFGRVWAGLGGGNWSRVPDLDPPFPVSEIKFWMCNNLITENDVLYMRGSPGQPWQSAGQWPGGSSVHDAVGPVTESAAVSPNPTDGPCRVSFTLAADSPVSVDLVDATGRIVRRLLDGPHPAGEYSLKWDGKDDAGRDLPAGVYFTHVTTGEGMTTGRVVVAR